MHEDGSAAGGKGAERRKAIESAMEMSRQGMPELALERLRPVLREAPDDSAALLAQGVALLHMARVEEAADALQRACDASPHDGQLWYQLSLAAARLGDAEREMEALRKAVGLHPSHQD